MEIIVFMTFQKFKAIIKKTIFFNAGFTSRSALIVKYIRRVIVVVTVALLSSQGQQEDYFRKPLAEKLST